MVTSPAVSQFDNQLAVKRTPNKVGRPRAFQDDDVYRVMMGVISEVGYARLTFALIAVQIKCTTSALIRRFGDKKSLVQGFILWITQQQEEPDAMSHASAMSARFARFRLISGPALVSASRPFEEQATTVCPANPAPVSLHANAQRRRSSETDDC